ncbi:MAG: fructose-1,6-bisphosphatase [Bacteroidaceae bacterium]|nr:fructose-1,6-bisphosphatase [Bacteroidaceae bacterium]
MIMTGNLTPEDIVDDVKYLQLLARSFPTVAAASSEIINLEAILNLPKGTEHFLSDVHGEYEAFQHVLKNASGTVKRKVEEIFAHSLRDQEIKDLCTLIYYPEEKLRLIKKQEGNLDDWYRITLNRLVKVCQNVSSKYTRSKVRKALPKDFEYIIQELLHESSGDHNKEAYLEVIITTIISTRRADAFIVAMCNLIQRLCIDSLHIVGDIFDRGMGAHIIMDTLCEYHNFDIQWGNHDVLWMGAAAGNTACIANVIRMCMRYANLTTLEDGYGINLLPLATFAMDVYKDDPCTQFQPLLSEYSDNKPDEKTARLIAQMHKAITIIQFKLEAEIIRRHPEYRMEDRLLLDKIDFQKGSVRIDGKDYVMLDSFLPTVNPADPYALTDEERDLMDKIVASFLNSEKLRKHMHCLYSNGSMFKVTNSNLLFHASIPLNADGTFKHVRIGQKEYWGKSLMLKADRMLRAAYYEYHDKQKKRDAMDYVWYLWCGADTPTFDKSKMATFERYFVADKETYKEEKGYYYELRDQADVCDNILREFGIEPGSHSHIINGHVPVRTIKGEKPVKADGKLLVIDGGFSKAYQPTTGIAGYTLVYHSHGFELVQHEPFESREKAIKEGLDIKSTTFLVDYTRRRMMVKDTDKGRELREQINELQKLLVAFRSGLVQEKD